MNDMKIVYRNPKDLREAEYNPRKITDEQFSHLCDSLKNFDCVEPIIVNKNPARNDIIVGGHKRRKAMLFLAYDRVPTIEVNLSLEDEKELNVRLNKNTGEFDFDILKEHFELPDLLDYGFEIDELAGIAIDDDLDSDGPDLDGGVDYEVKVVFESKDELENFLMKNGLSGKEKSIMHREITQL